MTYVIYALWIIALIIALRFIFSLYYQWKFKDIVKQNSQASRKLLLRYASPLGLILLLSFALQNQPINAPTISSVDNFKMIPTQQAEYNHNFIYNSTLDQAKLKGYVILEEDGVEVKYFVIEIRGKSYLIKDPIDE